MSLHYTGPLERLMCLSVADSMSREVAVIPASATMDQAARILADNSASGAPVVDEAGQCVGVLSATDFVTFEIDRSDELPSHGRCSNMPPDRQYIPWNSVRRFMATAVQTISSDSPLTRAAEIMCAEHIHRLVVLNERSIPIGVLATLDVVSALLSAIDESSGDAGSRFY